MDIIIFMAYIIIGIRWLLKGVIWGEFSSHTNWKIITIKAFILLMVPLALFIYNFNESGNQGVLLEMLVLVLCQIADYLLFKEMQRTLIKSINVEMAEKFNKELKHQKSKFQIRITALSIIVFMGLLSYFFTY